MSAKGTISEINVDLVALRQAKADRALQRDSVDFSGKLSQLREFSVLSHFARRNERKN